VEKSLAQSYVGDGPETVGLRSAAASGSSRTPTNEKLYLFVGTRAWIATTKPFGLKVGNWDGRNLPASARCIISEAWSLSCSTSLIKRAEDFAGGAEWSPGVKQFPGG